MSPIAMSASASLALPAATFRPHGHRRGAHPEPEASFGSAGGRVGQLPVGATSNLLANLLQSLQHTVAAQRAASAGGTGPSAALGSVPAAGAVAAGSPSPGLAQDLQGFMHSLVLALRQDGLGGGAAASHRGVDGAPTGPAVIPAAGQYQGSLASSLQALILKLGANGTPNAATSNLQISFDHIVNDLNAGGTTRPLAATNTASNPSSPAALQNFLNNLLQNVQNNGAHSLNAVGANVNANV